MQRSSADDEVATSKEIVKNLRWQIKEHNHQHAQIQKVLSEGVQLNYDIYLGFLVFVLSGGREDLNTTNGGHHWPASETPFKWCFADGPMMVQDSMMAW